MSVTFVILNRMSGHRTEPSLVVVPGYAALARSSRERKLLRADCHAAKISYNLSDDWQALQLRLALAAGVKTAKETPDELLRALPNPAAIVGSKWLSKQDGRALPYKRMRDISFYDPSLQVVPVIALAPEKIICWISSVVALQSTST